jgi:hypothetical protein
VPSHPSRIPRAAKEETMTTTNFILLLNALAQVIAAIAKLATAIRRRL